MPPRRGPTPLQRKTGQLVRRLGVLALVLAAAMSGLALFRHEVVDEGLRTHIRRNVQRRRHEGVIFLCVWQPSRLTPLQEAPDAAGQCRYDLGNICRRRFCAPAWVFLAPVALPLGAAFDTPAAFAAGLGDDLLEFS